MTDEQLFDAVHKFMHASACAFLDNGAHELAARDADRDELLKAIRAWARRDDILQAEHVAQLGALGDAAAKELAESHSVRSAAEALVILGLDWIDDPTVQLRIKPQLHDAIVRLAVVLEPEPSR